MSVTYFAEDWSLRFGLSNVFDKEPPLVDGNEILSLNNAPIGYGYDLNGQVAFLSFSTSL
jgi:iron complex outermembrane receptor protein